VDNWITYIILSITNEKQRYTISFITVDALHVSGGFSAHHQELNNCTHSIWYVPGLLAATASVGELEQLNKII
jgi:gamma-glutamyl:cysteine ligase YbdK (ATP-grasp superfamily)